jgi:hypothetical protein
MFFIIAMEVLYFMAGMSIICLAMAIVVPRLHSYYVRKERIAAA